MAEIDLFLRSQFFPELSSTVARSVYADENFSKICDTDIPDPVAKLFERARFEQVAKAAGLDWDQELAGAPIAKTAHADGVEVKKIGLQTWHYQYKSGAVIRSTVHDPELPGGVMHFDADGNEAAA